MSATSTLRNRRAFSQSAVWIGLLTAAALLTAIALPQPAVLVGVPLLWGLAVWLFATRQALGSTQRTEVQYRTLFADDLTGNYISRPDGTILDCNLAFARMFGFDSVEQARATPATELYLERADYQRFVSELQARRRIERQEATFRRRDGSPIDVSQTVVGDFDDTGRLVGVHGYLYDITESKRAQAALAQSEATLRAVVANAPVVLWAIDRGGVFTMSEGKGLEALGLKPGESVGKSVAEVYGHAPHILTYNSRALGGETFAAVVELGNLVFEAWYSPLRDESGGVTGAIGVAVDVTERTRLEAQLRHAQKMKAIGQLAGGIAHDFNNLLTAILGYCDVILDRAPAGDPLHEAAENIRMAGDNAATLTRQLLAFSRRQVIQPRAISLNDVVDEVASLLRRVIGENVMMQTRLAPGLDSVWADPAQVHQVLLNLAVNARDAMPEGGTLTIETSNAVIDGEYSARHRIAPAPGPYVRLSVADTGIGIDADTRARLFEPFFTTKAPGKGTGLGLATVYGIVKQSGGYVWVYSEPGRGATFKVYLPAHKAAVAPDEGIPPEAEPPRSGNETILLVEDEDAVRTLGQRGLAAYGYTVLAAATAEAAINIARLHNGPIHLVVTDIVLPGVSGDQLARRLEQDRPDMPVLFVSGYAEHHLAREGVLAPGVCFLEKPFTPRQLAERVRQVLDSRGSRRDPS